MEIDNTLNRIAELQSIRLDYQNYILCGEMSIAQYEEWLDSLEAQELEQLIDLYFI